MGGNVLRRILRRGIRFATENLNAKPGFFSGLVDTVCDILGDFFPELNKDPQAVKDVIDEEETQFLKTLTRGRRLLDRTIGKMESGVTVLPGDVAWRLYDTYGFPVDLTQLMAEEKGLEVDNEGYEKCKAAAQLASSGKAGGAEDTLSLDVHALNDLKSRGFAPTDDSPKYEYVVEGEGKGAGYKFASSTGKILAIRYNKQFVNNVASGQECGLLLDKTAFYAEQGGQIFDEGFIVKGENEMRVTNVQVRGGYVLHMGPVEGAFAVGDEVECNIDEERRYQVMGNHTGTHVLNFALRRVLKDGADQRGSLVAPERLRFDFTHKCAMTPAEVKKVEEIANEMINKNQEVFAKEAPLALAKTIQGLRAVFDETYPDPVRVVAVGVSVEKLEADPSSPEGPSTSVEFCGGTHLRRAGHMNSMVIATEEAIAKGIRRIVALTGQEAVKAQNKERLLKAEVDKLAEKVKDNDLSLKEKVRFITELGDDISAATISYAGKDAMRNQLKVVNTTVALLGANPGLPYLVYNLQALANNKAVDGALKQVKALNPDLPAIFISGDVDTNKVLAMAYCPKSAIEAGLKANEWCGSVLPVIGGKGGGKPDNAQGSGANVTKLREALKVADEYAQKKLGVGKATVVEPTGMEALKLQ